MPHKRIDCRELAKKFNELRENNLSRNYDRKELVSALKGIGVNVNLAQYLITRKNIWKTGRTYRFLKEPVHYSVFEAYFSDKRDYKRSSRRNMNHASVSEVTDKLETCISSHIITDEMEKLAIRILKERNYRVLRPKTEYEEI